MTGFTYLSAYTLFKTSFHRISLITHHADFLFLQNSGCVRFSFPILHWKRSYYLVTRPPPLTLSVPLTFSFKPNKSLCFCIASQRNWQVREKGRGKKANERREKSMLLAFQRDDSTCYTKSPQHRKTIERWKRMVGRRYFFLPCFSANCVGFCMYL